MILGKKIVVVLPAYNAESTLQRTLAALPPGIVDETILVDDASRDNTVALARALGLHTLVHRVNLGYGGNQKTCYTEALGRGADIVVMLHPDYQYDPRLVPAMASLIASGVYDVVLGSRILGRGALKGGMPGYKYVANRLLTLAENLLLGEKLSEYHTGYRAFSREVLETLPLEANSNDFVFDNEMLAQVFYFGFRVGEVSCPTRYEPESSSINFRRSCIYGLGVLRTAVQYRLAKHGLARPALFRADSPRLDRERIRSRLIGDPATEAMGGAPSVSMPGTIRPSSPGPSLGPAPAEPALATIESPSREEPAAPQTMQVVTVQALPAEGTDAHQPARRQARAALRLLLAALLVVTVAPALAGGRLIAGYAAIPRIVAQHEWDALLTARGQLPLSGGQGVVVDGEGAIYLAEQGRRRLVAFPQGISIGSKVLAERAGDVPLRSPYGLALGPDSNLYLLDSGNGFVHVFRRSGELVRSMKLALPGARVLAVDGAGAIYIGDTATEMVRRFLPSGEIDTNWGDPRTPGATIVGQAIGIAIVDGRVFVAVPERLVCLDERGRVVWARQPVGNTGWLAPGPSGTLLMTDDWGARVWVLNTAGDTIARVTGSDESGQLFAQPRGIAYDERNGRLYVVNENRVSVYQLSRELPR